MSTASKVLIAGIVVLALLLGFVWFFLLPADSSTPTIRQRNTVDHIVYSGG